MSVQARAQDYAAAIYDLAFESWMRQLESVQKALRRDAALRAAVDDPGRPTRERLQSLDQAVPGKLSPDVRNFLGTMLDAGQINMLDAVLAEFDRMVQRQPERKHALVMTAVALTAEERASLENGLNTRFGPDLEFEYKIDASLLGGVYLRVGDRVIDGSLAGKLAAMREQLQA